MRVEALVPDIAPQAAAASPPGAFERVLDAVAQPLRVADASEAAFAQHRGDVQTLVIDRARADIVLQIATAAAQRATQGLQSLLGMQV